MSRIVTGKCKKCGGYVQFDIGDMNIEAAKDALKSQKSWHCNAGNHMELISPMDLYEFDWDNIKEHVPMTEEEFRKDLESKFKEVYSSEEFQDKYTVDSFMMGKCLCHPVDGDEDALTVFDFVHGPTNKRYYILML